MPIDTKELATALSLAQGSTDEVRELFVAAAARDIVATAEAFAPGTDDFRDAVHADGPDGLHALVVVEDEIAEVFRRHPRAVNAMRDSIEWDEVVRKSGGSRAALAVVNEALAVAEGLWAERMDAKPAPGF